MMPLSSQSHRVHGVAAQLTGVAGEDAAVAQAARLQHKQQLGQQPLQLIDGPALHCSALKAALNQAPPHRFQPPCSSQAQRLHDHLSVLSLTSQWVTFMKSHMQKWLQCGHIDTVSVPDT